MAVKLINIHFEGINDKGEKLRRLKDEGIVGAISIAPYTVRNGWYSDDVLGLVKDLLNGEWVLGQQGNNHKCKYKHKVVDPWHENFCLYNPPLTNREQRMIMKKGKESLMKVFSYSPEMYVPPNHQFDEITLYVAEMMGYKYFAERGLVHSHINNYKNMIVVPETKFSEKAGNDNAKYVYYDKIEKTSRFWEFVKDAQMFSKNLPFHRKILRDVNQKATCNRKFLRDIIKLPSRLIRVNKD